MAFITPKTDWTSNPKRPLAEDFNRIEGNILDIYNNIVPGKQSIYDAIVSKGITPASKEFAALYNAIMTASLVNTADATATAAQILTGYNAYINGVKTSGTMVNHPGTITANNFYADGTGWLNHFIPYGAYLQDSGSGSGTPNVRMYDANFIEANIKKDISMFGLTGTLVPIPTVFAAGDILLLKDTNELGFTGNTATAKKSATLSIGGTVRVSIDLKRDEYVNPNVYFAVNDVQVGTAWNSTQIDFTYTTFTRDITINAGDKISLYCGASNGYAYLKNFTIKTNSPVPSITT